MKTKLKIALAGAVHVNMPGDDRGVITTLTEKMSQFSAKYDFDLVTWPKPIQSEEDGDAARRFFDAEEVDFALLLNASLPFGRVMLPLSKAKCRLGFWAVPEGVTDGVLPLNSFCGLNLMGSVISHYTSRAGFPGKWFYGYPDSPMFTDRFLCTLRALKAIKGLETLRVGQIGGLANGFENMYIDERDLERKFGTYLQTRHSVEEIVARAGKYSAADAEAEVKKMQSEAKRVADVPAEHMEKAARIFLAFRDFAKDNGYDALAISCWPRFQEVYGIAVCGTMSRLNEHGILAVCEADIFSTVCMAALKAMTGMKPALSDLVSLDESDQSANLWHCGVAPASWANDDGLQWDRHFNIGKYEGDKWCGNGVVADMRFRPGPVTVLNMSGRFDQLFLLSGKVMAEKKGYSGSGGWVGDLKINGKAVDIPTLINTVITRGISHHYASSYEDLTNEMNEFAAWLDINIIDPVDYQPYLQK